MDIAQAKKLANSSDILGQQGYGSNAEIAI
jgi:hypothetical protein